MKRPDSIKKKIIVPRRKRRASQEEEQSKFGGGRVDHGALKLILEDIELGAPPEVAAIGHGIDRDTFERWLSYENIRKKIDEAEAKAVLIYYRQVAEKAKNDPQMSLLILQNRWPEKFGKPPVSARELKEKKNHVNIVHHRTEPKYRSAFDHPDFKKMLEEQEKED